MSLFRLLLPACCAFTTLLGLSTPTSVHAQAARGTKAVTGANVAPAPTYRHYHALLIGINRYPDVIGPTITLAINDVNALKEVLVKSYRFPESNVVMRTDAQATKTHILNELGRLADTNHIDKEDCVLVYFAGHGATVPLPTGEQTGFLIPSDARCDLYNTSNAAPYVNTCIDMHEVWDFLNHCPARHVLLIADVCFAGLLTNSRGSSGRPATLATWLSKYARETLTAGGQGETSQENQDWGHGAFTFALLKELTTRATTPGVPFTASELSGSLKTAVANLTYGRQTPQFGTQPGKEGEFLFFPVSTGAGLAAQSSVSTPSVGSGADRGRSGATQGADTIASPRPDQSEVQGDAKARASMILVGIAAMVVIISVSLAVLMRRRLHGAGHTGTVVQLVQPDRPPQSAPPPSDNVAVPNNLPPSVTSFVGRESEIAEAKRLLASTHLFTLTGSGGCGKTRLALQVAAAVLTDYPDGVWLIALDSLTDGGLVAQAVAQTLAVREEPNIPVVQTLTQYLKSKRLLLVLDNCEHLAAACAHLCDSLIHTCPHLRILASSREALDIPGELSYLVPPLSAPNRQTTTTVDSLKQYESARLFVERATFALSEFRLTSANAPAVAQLCYDLDGMPLAIELAAACVRSMPVEQVAAHLDDRFRWLRRKNQASLPRQQTLRALIDWSYNLLDTQEKTLLARLSVFAGGWSLEAVETVCGDTQERVETNDRFPLPPAPSPLPATLREQEATPPPSRPLRSGRREAPAPRRTTPATPAARLADAIHPPLTSDDVLGLLANLVNKSLVVYEPQEQAARYRLLETVRQYTVEKLAESGEAEVVRRRHRDYFLALAERAEEQFGGAEAGYWLNCLEAEHDNLRLVARWFLEDADSARSALRLTGALWRFWYLRGYWNEGHTWMARALEKGADLPGDTRVQTLTGVANIARRRGDLATAQSSFEECLAILRSAQASPVIQRGIASTLQDLAIVARDRGKPDESLSLLEQSLNIRRTVGDETGVADASIWLGILARDRQDYAAARALFEQSLAIYQAGNNDARTVYALHSLGLVAQERGDDAAAHSYYERSLTIRQKLGDRPGEAETLTNLGNMAFARGDGDAARSAHEKSLAIRQELGDAQGKADSLCNLGWALLLLEDYAEAAVHLQDSLKLYRELDNKLVIPECLEGLAGAASGQGQNARAARLLGAAHALHQTLQTPPLTHGQQIENERRIALVRAALTTDSFTEQWTYGAAMTTEEAIGYGLEAAPS